ncbi:hypothetical protein [Qipengyuania gelatinilytica]|uniref:Uncharacterized protein n=1 Tax=Qipengyuania gelatinilytica TaxID=2867231 RepID=A0ABX9A3U8_9SPHN|nr:hypothetical protein [Qipengyuania gelatinilytica]QZD94874.1 hypothetical protein K3136_12435 [Qipengyuania gelatinilytica]
MPIWFEVIALMLVAYLIGLTIGWALWSRAPAPPADEDFVQEERDDT